MSLPFPRASMEKAANTQQPAARSLSLSVTSEFRPGKLKAPTLEV